MSRIYALLSHHVDHLCLNQPFAMCRLAEPDNEASLIQPQSSPCSPVRTLQELHPKLSSSPPRASPLRSAGPAYSFKKGTKDVHRREVLITNDSPSFQQMAKYSCKSVCSQCNGMHV